MRVYVLGEDVEGVRACVDKLSGRNHQVSCSFVTAHDLKALARCDAVVIIANTVDGSAQAAWAYAAGKGARAFVVGDSVGPTSMARALAHAVVADCDELLAALEEAGPPWLLSAKEIFAELPDETDEERLEDLRELVARTPTAKAVSDEHGEWMRRVASRAFEVTSDYDHAMTVLRSALGRHDESSLTVLASAAASRLSEQPPTPAPEGNRPSPDDLITVEEASRLVKRAPSTIWRWARSGRVPRFRQLNRTMFRRADIEREAERQRMPSEATPLQQG